MSKIFGTAMSLSFLVMGFVQMSATYSFFAHHLDWPGILAMLAGGLIAYIPLIGSVAGMVGAVKSWGWDWLHAALLFFWWPTLCVVLGVFGAGVEFIANASPLKRVCALVAVFAVVGLGVWWAQGERKETDWIAERIPAHSPEAFAKGFVHNFKKVSSGQQQEILFCMYEIYFIEQKKKGVQNPFESTRILEDFSETLALLYKTARKDGGFSLLKIIPLHEKICRDSPTLHAEFEEAYAPVVRRALVAISNENNEADMRQRLEGLNQMGKDLMQ